MVSDLSFLSRKGTISKRLNPYSTGRWFLIIKHLIDEIKEFSLNPYSTGRWFLMITLKTLPNATAVLILILLEDGF